MTIPDFWIALGQFLDDHAGSISAVSTVFVAAFTYTLWRATTKLWESSKTHATHLENSIAEAGRSAAAMERVADSLDRTATSAAENTQIVRELSDRQRDFAKMQMRPYIALIDPGFIPQNRTTPYFAEIQLTLLNTGHTPAHSLRFAARVRKLPVPLPDNFDFTFRPDEILVSGHINPGQRLFFRRNLGGLIADEEHEAIIQGRAMERLYIYGTVWFDDVFGDPHHTNFCSFGMWDSQHRFSTLNTPQHNDAS